jgi:hypothetical protein
LPAEYGDVFGAYPAASPAEKRLGLLLDADRINSLAAQFGPHQVGRRGNLLPFQLGAALVASLPEKYGWL